MTKDLEDDVQSEFAAGSNGYHNQYHQFYAVR